MMRRVCNTVKQLVLVLALLVALVPTVAAKQIITFRHWDDNVTKKAVFDEFNRIHPDIEVVIEPVPSGGYIESLAIEMATGGGPDLFSVQLWPSAGMPVYDWAENGMFLDLTPFWERDRHELEGDEWFPFVLEGVRFANRMIALPYGWSVFGAIAYNGTLLENYGIARPDESWTWDDLAAASRLLTRVDENGVTVQWGLHFDDFDEWVDMEDLIVSSGGSLYNADQTALALNTQEARRALDMVAELAQTGAIRPSPGFSDLELWVLGKRAFRRRPIHHLPIEWPRGQIADTGVVVSPKDPWTGDRKNSVEIMAIGINANTKDPEAAWKALKFFTKEYAKASLATLGFIQVPPAIPSDMELFMYQDGDVIGPRLASDLPQLVHAMSATAIINPPVVNPATVRLETEIKQLLAKEWYRVLNQEIPVDYFIENVSRLVNQRLLEESATP